MRESAVLERLGGDLWLAYLAAASLLAMRGPGLPPSKLAALVRALAGTYVACIDATAEANDPRGWPQHAAAE